jgi:hypothetical protein
MRTATATVGAAMLLVRTVAAAVPAPDPVGRFVLMEPARDGGGTLPLFQEVTDSARLARCQNWLRNDAARTALDLYRRARAAAGLPVAVQPADFLIALVPNGSSTNLGFRLRQGGVERAYPRAAFVELGDEEWRFSTMLLHESGHVALLMLAGGRRLPTREIAAIPHTTAALTDRTTAFNEGFAIHLETLFTHLDLAARARIGYRQEAPASGTPPEMTGLYYRQSADLLGHDQFAGRYLAVRDNWFAFASACRGPDYVRVQMEGARDFATLRDADQLLQSEGFHAAFFFAVLTRGDAKPDVIRVRQGRMLAVLAIALRDSGVTADEPFLIRFVQAYLRLYPAEAPEIVDVLLDLSHGVFVDADAAALWRAHYLAALGLDVRELNLAGIEAARTRWRKAVSVDARVLLERLGPQLRCEVAGRTVVLAGMQHEAPLSFDVNSAEEGVMRLVPGISEIEVASWLAARAQRPFAAIADFKRRSGLSEKTLAGLRF